MENGDNILDAIFEEDNLDEVEMIDVEEGELAEEEQHDSQNLSRQNGAVGTDDRKPQSKNRRRRANKRNRRKGSATGAVDINRFVIDTCRRLKEKKSYMVYPAVACLGVSALSDLIKEVDAIQACGDQKTAGGRRFRTGGGLLWSIIKVREPNAYKEIMKKAKEFEKQFRQPSVKQQPKQKKEDSSQGEPSTFASGHQGNVSDHHFSALQMQDQHKPPGSEEKRNFVHDRLRIPVSYDDDLLGLSADNNTI
ncbi:Phosphorylated adapter RNA export protein, RNA-binding domain [Spatholobus suberectus]|nr:Phosphorylated adapter RNA export protein, RNA-binding domain [Spatholobus suberectus]